MPVRLEKLLLVLVTAAVLCIGGEAFAADNPEGAYIGRFTNSDGATHRMLTEFIIADGEFSGRYLAGNSDVVLGDDAGSLSFISRKGLEFTFRWTDRWGSGLAYLTFANDFGSFTGLWTYKSRVEGNWTGTRR